MKHGFRYGNKLRASWNIIFPCEKIKQKKIKQKKLTQADFFYEIKKWDFFQKYSEFEGKIAKTFFFSHRQAY